jgi:hypothetical protein
MALARGHARRLHAALGVESFQDIDVAAVARRLGVQIVDAPLQGALAQLVINGSSARILLSHHLGDPRRRRAAVAHELGHYMLEHPSPTVADLCARRPHWSQRPAVQRDVEREAEAFMRELLMPHRAVDAVCRGSAPDLALCTRLAGRAQVPIEHAAMRIADSIDRSCAAVLSTPAGIIWIEPSARFVAEFGTSVTSTHRYDVPLDPRTVAGRLLQGVAVQPSAEVPAEAWFGISGSPLRESSAWLVDGKTILTMLWAKPLEDHRARSAISPATS